MIDNLCFRERAVCRLAADRGAAEMLNLRGVFHVEHWRDGRKINEFDAPNLITNEGKNRILDVMFHGVTPHNPWYIGLIDGAGTPTPAVGDTYANINQSGNAWTEFSAYDEATRGEWTEGAAAGQAVTNASPVVFTVSATGSVYGLFLCAGTNAATKNDYTAGSGHCLWNAVAFTTGTVPVVDGDQLKITYTVRA